MTEQEKLLKAGFYMEQLARGIDPITGNALPQGGALAHEELSLCFSYIAGVLKKVTGEEKLHLKPRSRTKKAEFSLTKDQIARIPVSEASVTLHKIVSLVNACIDAQTMKRLREADVLKWLEESCFLAETVDADGEKRRLPTVRGNRVGITTEPRQGARGEYSAVLYSENAQRLVLRGLGEMGNLNRE